jgi:hypothetical protein
MLKIAAAKENAERIEKMALRSFLSITDARGHDIGQGFVVMEVPFKNAGSEEQALKIGEKIRDEMQGKIPSRDALYQQ